MRWATATVEWLPNLLLALVVGVLLVAVSKAVRAGVHKAVTKSKVWSS